MKRLLAGLVLIFQVGGCAVEEKQKASIEGYLDTTTPIAELKRLPQLKCVFESERREEVRARHIVAEVPILNTEMDFRIAHARARMARAELERGIAFDVVESNYSQGAMSRGKNGGDIGFVKRGKLVRSVEAVAFCMPIDTISPVFGSEFGFHILEVTDVRYKTQ